MRKFIGDSDPVVHDSGSGPETENDGDDIEASARDGNSSKREKSQSPYRDLIAPSVALILPTVEEANLPRGVDTSSDSDSDDDIAEQNNTWYSHVSTCH